MALGAAFGKGKSNGSQAPRDRITGRQRVIERRNVVAIAVLVVVLVLTVVAELSFGASDTTVWQSVQALFGIGDQAHVVSVQSIRLPRCVCAIVAGAILAVAGAALQSVLENPLASPSTVGISQGAAFGATLAILVVIPSFEGLANNATIGATAIFAFVGALISSGIVLVFSTVCKLRAESIVLVGVALASLWGGAETILQYFAEATDLAKVMFWEFGSVGRASWSQIGFMAVVAALISVFFFMNSWNYNALQNGSRVAGGLGMRVARTRILTIAVASFGTAAAISFIGLVAFVGLIAPHIARILVGNDYRYLLPASLVLGSIIMLGSDLLARMVMSPIVLPIGAITSFLGAPLFLALLYRGYRRG